jgi:CRISPR-associated protein (TIGR02710 family)
MDSLPDDQFVTEAAEPASRFRVLFQSVGTGSAQHPVWEALAFAVRQIKPDVLVQCCSTLTATQTIPLFDEVLGDVEWSMQRILNVSDRPDDINDLAQSYTRLMERYRRQYPEAEFHVDFTSGTKAMSVAIAVAGVLCEVAQTHYSVGERDEGGRAVKTNTTHPFLTTDLIARHRLLELKELFHAGRFDLICRQAPQDTLCIQDPDLRIRLETMKSFAEAFAKWDQFEWRHAKNALKTIRLKKEEQIRQAGWDIVQLDRNIAHLRACEEKPFSMERVADLYTKAYRVFERGDFDEFSLRCYRIIEYIGQYRFAYIFGRDTSDTSKVNSTGKVPAELLRQRVPVFHSELSPSRISRESGTVSLGLGQTLDVLSELGDAYGIYAKSIYVSNDGKQGKLHNLLELRNQSWLAHGADRVKESKAKEMKDITEELARLHLNAPMKTLSGDEVTVGDRSFDDYVAAGTFVPCPAWYSQWGDDFAATLV